MTVIRVSLRVFALPTGKTLRWKMSNRNPRLGFCSTRPLTRCTPWLSRIRTWWTGWSWCRSAGRWYGCCCIHSHIEAYPFISDTFHFFPQHLLSCFRCVFAFTGCLSPASRVCSHGQEHPQKWKCHDQHGKIASMQLKFDLVQTRFKRAGRRSELSQTVLNLTVQTKLTLTLSSVITDKVLTVPNKTAVHIWILDTTQTSLNLSPSSTYNDWL